MNNYWRGKIAELMARLYLRLHGYRIIASNVCGRRGTNVGEIDIIACRKKSLIFAEIKTRKTLDSAAYAISYKQQQRLIRGAENFVRIHPRYIGYELRFDAILIVFPCKIVHIPNAWMASHTL